MDEPWLDEALVQYVTWLYYVDAYGERAAQGYRDSWVGSWDRVDRADVPIGLPSGAYTRNQYGAIVYGRGPLFIEALAEEMGQEVFDEFLRNYYESHQWGIGTGDTFRLLAEQRCQCDLTGAAGFAGIAGRQGIQMAISQINANGGLNGRKLRLIAQDSASTPDGGVLATRKLIQDNKVVVYYGAADTVVGIAFAHLDELTVYIKENSL